MSQDTTKTLAKNALFQMEFAINMINAGINMLNAGRIDTANACFNNAINGLQKIIDEESDNG